MSKSYSYFARDSKANASAAYSTTTVRVQLLRISPVTHKHSVVEIATFSPGDFDTLTKAIQSRFGILHGQRDRLIYEVGRG